MNPDRRTPANVTLEDLLRIKRAERPPAEFWLQFDRDLRAKQLAAIVEPRPWWAPLIRVGARISRYQLPVGATAILALTLVTVREYRQPEIEGFVPATAENALAALPGPAVAESLQPNVSSVPERNDLSHVVASADVSGPEAVASASRQLDALPGPISEMVPMLGGRSLAASTNDSSPSARSIAANLAAVKASEPELAKLIDRVPGLETQAVAATRSPATDPLAQMQSPGDVRRSRILSGALPAVSYANAETGDRRTTTRVDRDLTDERLYERIGRFDMAGERLAINFKL